MNIEEFNSLELKDKVLYKGKILTVKFIQTQDDCRGIIFHHNNEEVLPSFSFTYFWNDIEEHQELIKLMIKIPNR